MVQPLDSVSFLETGNVYFAAALATVGVPLVPDDPIVDYKGRGKPKGRCFKFLDRCEHATVQQLRESWEKERAGKALDDLIDRLREHPDENVRAIGEQLKPLSFMECMEMCKKFAENVYEMSQERAARPMRIMEHVGKYKLVVCDDDPGPKFRERFKL